MVHTKMEVNCGECQGEGNQDCIPKGGQCEVFFAGTRITCSDGITENGCRGCQHCAMGAGSARELKES